MSSYRWRERENRLSFDKSRERVYIIREQRGQTLEEGESAKDIGNAQIEEGQVLREKCIFQSEFYQLCLFSPEI